MRTLIMLFSTLMLTFHAFAFDGVVTYSQFDFVDKKRVPSITQKISVYFSENKIRRLRVEFDPQKFKTSAYDTFIDYDKKSFTAVDVGHKSYVQHPINFHSKMPGELVYQDEGSVINGQATSNFTFNREYPAARKIIISYSKSLKVEPVQYLHSILDAQAWGINPNNGAIALRFFFQLDAHHLRVIQATDISERKLNSNEIIPNLSGFIKK